MPVIDIPADSRNLLYDTGNDKSADTGTDYPCTACRILGIGGCRNRNPACYTAEGTACFIIRILCPFCPAGSVKGNGEIAENRGKSIQNHYTGSSICGCR